MLQARRDPWFLADSIASSVVLAHDPAAQGTSVVYWEKARDAHQEALDALERLPDPRIAELRDRLAGDPSQVEAYRSLVAALAEWLRRSSHGADRLADIAWRTECVSRLRTHVGSQFLDTDTSPVGAAELGHLGPMSPAPAQRHPDAAVIVPFQERDPNGQSNPTGSHGGGSSSNPSPTPTSSPPTRARSTSPG